MLYTAAILMCLKNIDRTFDTCQVANTSHKYRTEEACWMGINAKLLELQNFPEINAILEPVDAKCIEWLPSPTKEGQL